MIIFKHNQEDENEKSYLCPIIKKCMYSQIKTVRCIVAAGLIALSSCQSPHSLVSIESSLIPMTAEWDHIADSKAAKAVAPYKTIVDSIMLPVVGRSAMDMYARRPESLLSNLVADILREATIPYTGRTADLAIMNMGGLRSSLPQGEITFGHVYEVLPFQNALCILQLKGKEVKELMQNIATVGGEGVSNIKLIISSDRKVISATIGGKPIEDECIYEVATIDYLAEGNDKMSAFLKAENKQIFPEATIRELFLNHLKTLESENKEISSQIEGRIEYKK